MNKPTITRGDLWSFLRNVLVYGDVIEGQARVHGWGYESRSAELDAAASRYADLLQQMLAATTPEPQS